MSTRNKLFINLHTVQENLRKLKRIAGNRTCFAVLKADAYGLGALPVYKAIESMVDGVCIAIPEEAKALIDGGCTKPILCFGFFPEEWWDYYLENEIRVAIYSLDLARKMNAFAKERKKKFYVHIALDTGHSRVGFMWNDPDIEEKLKVIDQMENLVVEGTYTHFASADVLSSHQTEDQIARYKQVTDLPNINFGIKHLCNDAGLIAFPEARFEGFRTGTGLYGIYPTEDIENASEEHLELAISWETVVIHVKEIEEGTPVSYGATWVAPRKTKVATIQVGYADGYPRLFSNQGKVKINGVLCPIIGRVCMDQSMVDVTGLDVEVGDKVILMDEDLDPNYFGDLAHTISYEVLTSINPRVTRVYI